LRINLGGVAANARRGPGLFDRDHGSDLHRLHLLHKSHYRLGIFLTTNPSNVKCSPLNFWANLIVYCPVVALIPFTEGQDGAIR
jgi:hypothetical protein